MIVKYFWTEHGPQTPAFMQAKRLDTYEEAESDAMNHKVISAFTTIRIYEEVTKEVGSVVAKVERNAEKYDQPR